MVDLTKNPNKTCKINESCTDLEEVLGGAAIQRSVLDLSLLGEIVGGLDRS